MNVPCRDECYSVLRGKWSVGSEAQISTLILHISSMEISSSYSEIPSLIRGMLGSQRELARRLEISSIFLNRPVT